MRLPAFQKRLSITVPLTYAFWSSVWILLSDQVLLLLGVTPDLLIQLSILKGWFFTLVTSFLLYDLIRRGERSLRESYALLNSIIEGTTDAIYVKDLQGHYVLINSSGADLLGQSVSDVIGRSDSDYWSRDELTQLRRSDQIAIAARVPQQVEEAMTVLGERRTYLTTKYPRFNVQGEVDGLIAIARDITERQRFKDEQARLMQQLEERNQDLEALNLVTANAISTLEVDALLHVLLDRLVTVMAADLGLIFLVQGDDLILGAAMGAARTDQYQDVVINREIARLIRTTGQLVDIQDLQQDPRFNTYADPTNHPRHVLGVPLKRQHQLVGVLQVEWHQLHTLTPREIHLLEITAERCAMAVINAQLFERMQQLQQRLQLQFDRSPISCMFCDRQGKIIDWNPAAIATFGYSPSEALGQIPEQLVASKAVTADLNRLAIASDSARLQENRTKDGRTILCEWHHTPLQANGETIGYLVMAQDVTERIQAAEQLRQYAYYDTLTRLPHRRLLKQRITERLEQSHPTFGLFHLDLVRFKVLKYSLGHDLAEQLLIAIAQRLQTCQPRPGLLSRIGTDEFALLYDAIATPEDAIAVAEGLQTEFSDPFQLGDHTVFVTITLGYVLGDARCGDAEAFLQAADLAMNHARLSKTTGYAAFDDALRTQAVDRLRLDSAMRHALAHQNFQLYYQPIISAHTRKLVGVEALLRWQQGQKWISPADFVPLAEETGFIVELGAWVLQQSCVQLRQWHQQFPSQATLSISVNVSVAQLKQPDILAVVDSILAETGIPPHCLKLEVTETAVMENAAQVGVVLDQLKARGIRLCIDDFGTGYSSLSYLRTFPFDTLKVDRSFVMSLDQDAKSLELIRMIQILAQNLSMELVAEGIETPTQLQQLQTLGCESVQGYLISPPLPRYDVEQAIARGEWPWTIPTSG
jgi:PAS domain S-box-containing protein/diguanylate cyclase (GGDEF)-like protein